MRFSIYLILSLIIISATAQDHPTCNTQRYRVDVFENVTVTNDVMYGIDNTIGGNEVELYMDIYEPEGDAEVERPVIVLAFGGSFINGTRGDISGLCTRFARKGYVAVSIDYRLYDKALIPLPTEREMQDVVIRAIKDMKTAIRFLDDDARAENTYGVDMDWLYLGGVSSGGITAAHCAILDSTDAFSESLQGYINQHAPIYGITDTDESIKIRGVLNYSGGLRQVDWIDAGDPPFISFHDDGDPTVPYKGGYAQIFGQNIIYLNGSFALDSVAQQVGVRSQLITFPRDAHVSYFFDEEEIVDVVNQSAFFMYEMICSETADVKNMIDGTPYTFGPNPTQNNIVLSTKGNAKVELYDLAGKQLHSQSIVNEVVLDLKGLVVGNYLLKITVNGKTYTERVVKD